VVVAIAGSCSPCRGEPLPSDEEVARRETRSWRSTSRRRVTTPGSAAAHGRVAAEGRVRVLRLASDARGRPSRPRPALPDTLQVASLAIDGRQVDAREVLVFLPTGWVSVPRGAHRTRGSPRPSRATPRARCGRSSDEAQPRLHADRDPGRDGDPRHRARGHHAGAGLATDGARETPPRARGTWAAGNRVARCARAALPVPAVTTPRWSRPGFRSSCRRRWRHPNPVMRRVELAVSDAREPAALLTPRSRSW